MKECVIPSCVREQDDSYCKKHQLAFEQVEETFSSWQVAYGEEFTYEQYLERLSEDYEIGTGQWAMDVAEYLLDKME